MTAGEPREQDAQQPDTERPHSVPVSLRDAVAEFFRGSGAPLAAWEATRPLPGSELNPSPYCPRDMAIAAYASAADREDWFRRRGLPDPVLAEQEAGTAARHLRETRAWTVVRTVSPDAEREGGR